MGFPHLLLATLVHCIAVLLVRLRYRFTSVHDAPVNGPAILVANHVSFGDPLLLRAAVKGPLLTLVDRQEYDLSPFRALLDLAGAIPVEFADPADRESAFELARRHLVSGGLVAIFPERHVTRTGFLNALHDDFSLLARVSGAPVVPVYIDSIRGSRHSVFGRATVRFEMGRRRMATVVVGEPLGALPRVAALRQALEELSSRAFELRRATRRTLGYTFIRRARIAWFKPALCDTTGKRVTFGKALIGAVALGDYLKQNFSEENKIGVILPASVGGVLLNTGATIAGKIPVNLNFTTTSDNIAQAIGTCGIETVVTSKKFMARMEHLTIPCRTVFLEDIAASISGGARFTALVKSLFVPAGILTRERRRTHDDCATIVFSSGSTSNPKGIVLTHHNVTSNIEQMCAVLDLSEEDCIAAALPFFHSFGLTATLWFPLLAGFRAAYHPNPLDGATIATVVRKERATILLATPTFLQTYVRKATRDDFQTLRLVVSGAEKLRPSLAREFHDTFGVAPLEGYGATELSPVACLNVPDVERWGRSEQGCRTGTIGRLLPGMSARIVNPETLEPLDDFREPGLLMVKGPNVMNGYLDLPEETSKVLRDGWYLTGDIAAVSSDGFVRLTDRLSRFSKIAGEMVPHGALEDILAGELRLAEPAVAVTAVPDVRRGEKLVVLYTEQAGTAEILRKIVESADIPNLWKPSSDAYVRVNTIPVLGTGKTDLKALRAEATRAMAASN